MAGTLEARRGSRLSCRLHATRRAAAARGVPQPHVEHSPVAPAGVSRPGRAAAGARVRRPVHRRDRAPGDFRVGRRADRVAVRGSGAGRTIRWRRCRRGSSSRNIESTRRRFKCSSTATGLCRAGDLSEARQAVLPARNRQTISSGFGPGDFGPGTSNSSGSSRRPDDDVASLIHTVDVSGVHSFQRDQGRIGELLSEGIERRPVLLQQNFACAGDKSSGRRLRLQSPDWCDGPTRRPGILEVAGFRQRRLVANGQPFSSVRGASLDSGRCDRH